jgi:hypothetical protein
MACPRASWRCQPSSKVKGTWIFSFARHLGQDVHEDAAWAEYPLPQLSHRNMISRFLLLV